MDITERIYQTIIRERLICRGDTVLVAVSGGLDSVVLLNILYQLRLKLGIQLQVAHYNHRARRNSGKDEDFVRKLSGRLHLPFLVGRRKGKVTRLSEDRARRLRLEFLKKSADKIHAQAVALAHHKNDLAETVLMRLIRGAGLSGLRGILKVSEFDGQRLIRPLLSVSKQDIERFAKHQRLKYCQDETNLQTDYLRNKIRLKILPELKRTVNGHFEQAFTDLADISQADYNYLWNEAEKIYKKNVRISQTQARIKISDFLKQHLSMRRLILRKAFEDLTSNLNELTFSHIQEVEDMVLNRPEGSIVHWPKSIKVCKKNTELIVYS